MAALPEPQSSFDEDEPEKTRSQKILEQKEALRRRQDEARERNRSVPPLVGLFLCGPLFCCG